MMDTVDESNVQHGSTLGLDRRGVVWGFIGVAGTLAITFVGNEGLVWFETATAGA
ncbi:MAG: hypothetical protein WKF60_00520 [Ilumatobacter sp.]